MKIGLFGHGKMGRAVESLAEREGIAVVEHEEADVCLDFSHPSVALDHVKWAVSVKKPLVIGTTTWEKDEEMARRLVVEQAGAVLAAPNFSLGMAYFTQLLKVARSLLKEYAVAGVEYHHDQKKDAPSGAAKALARALAIPPFASVRCGRMPGKHEVLFDSAFDTITLTHEAHGREGFATGALTAARWIQGKTGWYTLDDMLRDLYSAHYPL